MPPVLLHWYFTEQIRSGNAERVKKNASHTPSKPYKKQATDSTPLLRKITSAAYSWAFRSLQYPMTHVGLKLMAWSPRTATSKTQCVVTIEAGHFHQRNAMLSSLFHNYQLCSVWSNYFTESTQFRLQWLPTQNTMCSQLSENFWSEKQSNDTLHFVQLIFTAYTDVTETEVSHLLKMGILGHGPISLGHSADSVWGRHVVISRPGKLNQMQPWWRSWVC